jgi:hypothetical protein
MDRAICAWFEPIVTPARAIVDGITSARVVSRRARSRRKIGGAVARVGDDATAFADRRSPFTYNVIASWDGEAGDEANREWARGVAADLDRYGSGRAYVNFSTDVSPGDAVAEAYGAERHDRLVTVKRRWDPGNLFRLNQNVRP